MKLLWFDAETSGLDAVRNDILTLSGIIEIDGKIKETFDFKVQPFDYNNLDDEALKINGLTLEQIKTFEEPKKVHRKLVAILSKYVNRYNKFDKFQPSGYNVVFDVNFLGEFFKKCGDKYFGSWVDYHKLDVATLVQIFHLKNKLNLPNYKLVTACESLDIKINAHNSMSDIEATRELFYKLVERLEFKNS